MLPISQTTINPIIDLFMGINNHQTLPSQSDKGALGFLYINFAFLFLTTFVTILIYFYKRKDNEKIAKQKVKEGLFWMLLLTYSSLFTYFGIIKPTISEYNAINNLSLKSVFSNYNIDRVEWIKSNEKTVIYDAFGDKKPETQFKIHLDKTKNRNDIDKSMYHYLKKSVVVNVSKINKNSFDILLPDGQVVTIKEKEAKEIFNTLKKINEKESEK